VDRSYSRLGRNAVSLLTALAAATMLGLGAFAAVSPTGDRSAIVFYNQEVAYYAPLPGARVVETGYFFVHPNGGTSGGLWWGRPPPHGYMPGTATILEHLSSGKIVAYLAQFTGPKVQRLRVLMADGSVFLSTSRCWRKAPATTSPLGTGEAFLFNDGGTHFLPLVSGTASSAATFTYTWNPGAQARETDTFSPGSRPTVNTAIQVTGAQRMKITIKITPLATAPALPVPSAPLVPLPKPLCSTS
jgi:hypothetical protein